MTILLLEDDDSLCRGISFKLEKEGYQVFTAASVEKGLGLFAENQIDFIICDIGLEDGSGLSFCRKIRETSNVRFLFLTALDTEMDIVMGYEAGADDYMTKPFSLSVLLSKVNAVFARLPRAAVPSELSEEREATGEQASGGIVKSGNMVFSRHDMKLTIAGTNIPLTRNEFRLLLLFLEHPGQVLTKGQLLESLWDSGGDFVDDNTVAVNIRRLREKIEPDPAHPEYIKNIRGIGYLWDKAASRH